MKKSLFQVLANNKLNYIVSSLFKGKDSVSEDVSLISVTSLFSCEKPSMECLEELPKPTLPSLEKHIFVHTSKHSQSVIEEQTVSHALEKSSCGF